MKLTDCGSGDLETCGPCEGHPHDPRTDEGDADALNVRLRDAFGEIKRIAAAAETNMNWYACENTVSEALRIMADINAMSDFSEDV